jgi:hypothetical protein
MKMKRVSKIINKQKERFLTASDLNLRLSETLVGYKGELAYVQNATSDSVLSMYIFKSSRKRFSDPIFVLKTSCDLDLTIFDPGYIKLSSFVYYVVRLPARKQKQGLCKTNTTWFCASTGLETSPKAGLETVDFVAQLSKTYPNKVNSILFENLKEDFVVSRQVAVVSGLLQICLQNVGRMGEVGVFLFKEFEGNRSVLSTLKKIGVSVV